MTKGDDWRGVVERLSRAERPAVLVGPEGRSLAPDLLAIAEWLGAPVATTPDALSVIDGDRSCGVFSFGASAHARQTLARADLVLAVSDLGEFTCRLGEAFASHTVIQVVESAASTGRRRSASLSLLGPVSATVTRLRAMLERRLVTRRPAWFDALPPRAASSGPRRDDCMLPEDAADAIEAALPEPSRVCLDVTSGALHCYERWRLTTKQRVFSSIERSACMGEALLASLGVRLASGLPTLALVGDWGYAMTPAELHTAVELGLDRYVVVVWANGGGAFIGAGVKQQGLHVPEKLWRWQHPPSFSRVAGAYGADAVAVTNAAALERAVSEGLSGTRPLLIEARIEASAPIPAGDRFLTLGESSTRAAQPPPGPAVRKPRCQP